MQFEPTPPPSEPDRRYWRRHANRRVRKARRVKGLIDAGRMLVLPLLMGGVLTYSAMQIAYLLPEPGVRADERRRRRGSGASALPKVQ